MTTEKLELRNENPKIGVGPGEKAIQFWSFSYLLLVCFREFVPAAELFSGKLLGFGLTCIWPWPGRAVSGGLN
jgi:hypothetical protein